MRRRHCRRDILPRYHKRRDGYVLLMTVVLIAVAGLLLAGMARQSLLLAMDACEVQEDLQRRWGTISCQQTLLSQAESILEQPSEQDKTNDAASFTGTASRSARLILGGMQFDLLLADEGAKISLNTIYRRQGDEGISRLIQERVHGQSVLPMRLRPYHTDPKATEYPAFDSWGQVFSTERPELWSPALPMNLSAAKTTAESGSLVASESIGGTAAESLAASTMELTCWGDGRLNLAHAPDSVVEYVGRLVVTDRVVRQLLEARSQYLANRKNEGRKPSTASVANKQASGQPQTASALSATPSETEKHWLPRLLDRLQLRAGEREQIEQLLTDQSTCHSVWVTIRTKERSWHSFCVADSATRATDKSWSYCW